jgi:DeoR family transcriptional regulator, aga operon transcriptional repressor
MMVFICCDGVDPVAGVVNINLPEAEMKRRMIAAARRNIAALTKRGVRVEVVDAGANL